ncbi:MAG: 3-dehydroquinate synthase [Duncaniella sp.]|nr:3-dehydroquinate synthase [Duncaniella sp.]
MTETEVIFTLDAAGTLRRTVDRFSSSGEVAVITDTTVASAVIPALSLPAGWHMITFPAGEANKNIATCSHMWQSMSRSGMTRRSLVVNIGGGVTTDMGGFAAATFKRGLRFINIPTTLLCAVDAALGGKTGVDFDGLKNEIGVFAPAEAVIIDSTLFRTLAPAHLLSGYGEMIKHALLRSDKMFAETLALDILDATPAEINLLLEKNIALKRDIVAADPLERGLRKALNLGHTFGHALESLCISRGIDLPHGIAVVHGLVVAMILSHTVKGLSTEYLHSLASLIKRRGLSAPAVTCDDYPALLDVMGHDKKNTVVGHILFTLLSSPGNPVTDVEIAPADIRTALDIYRDLTE